MKKLALAVLVMMLLLVGCASTSTLPPPTPKPECAGAKIVGTQLETFGKAGVKTAWIGAMLAEPRVKPIMKAVALAAGNAVEQDSISGIINAMAATARDMGAGDWALLVTPVADLFEGYKIQGTDKFGELHPCDKVFLKQLFTELALLSGG